MQYGWFFCDILDTIITRSIGTEAFANSLDPDQKPHNAAPDQDLHCFPYICTFNQLFQILGQVW